MCYTLRLFKISLLIFYVASDSRIAVLLLVTIISLILCFPDLCSGLIVQYLIQQLHS
jgi:hypothetical protein